MRTITFLLAGSACVAVALVGVASSALAGERTFKLRGRLQADYTTAEADLIGFSGSWDDSEIRRARIGLEGTEGRIGYRAEVTLDDGDVLWEDVFVTINTGAATVIVGHWKVPVSLNEQTSSRHITSMERAGFTDAFNFNRRLGVGVSVRGDNHTFKAGVFGDNLNDATGASGEGTVAAARFTFNPINTDAAVVHLGASLQYRDAADGRPFRYRQRPQIHISDRFVNTGAFASSDMFYGVEAAYMAGPFHVAAEYGALNADGALADSSFQGAYVEGGVFLTAGDSKGYKNGVFDRTKPVRAINDGGFGAWELRGRVDWLDLEDGLILGGTQTSYTVGVNWFATNHVRFMGEYTYADIEDGPDGSGEVNAFSVRAAIDW